MLRSVFYRVAIAVVLMATVVAPYGSCQSQSRAAQHDCCPQASDRIPVVQQDCCIVRTQVPAVVKERSVPNTENALVARISISQVELASLHETGAAMIAGPHSPPDCASVLRI